MALYNKKEFSKICGIETKHLSTYINRKKVFVESNDLIDTTNQVNAAFILKAQAKIINKGGEILEEAVVYEAKVVKKQVKNQEQQVEEGAIQSISALDRKKLELDIEKKQADLEKVVLSNSKAKGEVIPFGLIKPLLSQNNQSFTTAFKNATDELIASFAKKRDLSSGEVAELNKILVAVINEAILKANDQSIKSIDLIIEDYQSTIK